MPVSRTRARLIRAVLAHSILLAGLCPPLATAQSPAEQPGVVRFAEEPFRLDSVGLTMLLPDGSTAQATQVGAKTNVQITPPDGSWLISIQTPRTGAPETTAPQALDEIVTGVMKEQGESYVKDQSDPNRPRGVLVGYRGEVLIPRHTVIINEQACERAYLKLPGSGSDGPVVRGFTVFKTTPTQFVIFELLVPEAGFARAKGVYQTVVGTAKFEDPTQIGAARTAAITLGIKLMQRIDETAMREIIEARPERWERCYRPSVTGADSDATELGYRRTRLSVGTRAALDPKGDPDAAGSRQPGFVAQIDARYLDRARLTNGQLTEGRIIDSASVFYSSFDRTDEAWTVRMAVRTGTPAGRSTPKVYAEMGGRSGKSLYVSIAAPGEQGRDVRPVFQGDGYISRLESLVLPNLLLRERIPGEYGFYIYQSDAETIRLRRDTLEQPSDRPGMWVLTTRFTEDKKSQTAVFNEKGDVVRTELADGSVWEPISLSRLVQLWKAKGLPME